VSYTPGPFDIEHLYLQWGGKLPGGEQWSCGIRIAEQGVHVPGATYVPPESDVDDWLNGAVKDAVAAYHTRAITAINPLAKLSFCKLNAIGTDGHYVWPLTHEHVFADLAGGGDAFNTTINQASVAVSLTTGFSRGPAHRGRFYLPMPAVQIGTDGLMVAAFANNIMASSKTFLEAIADTPGIDAPNSMTPMVMSRKLGAPAHRKITGCQVGRVVDTQRKRRRSLPETYSTTALDLSGW
jgi:hypothetical protein